MSVQQARRLRKRATGSGEADCGHVCATGRSANLKFRRQHPLGNRIVDFFCAEAKLAIELDGSGHLTDSGQTSDLDREIRPLRKRRSSPPFLQQRRLQQSRWRFERNYLRSRS